MIKRILTGLILAGISAPVFAGIGNGGGRVSSPGGSGGLSASAAANFLDVTGTTQTKTGGLNVNGTFTPGKYGAADGSAITGITSVSNATSAAIVISTDQYRASTATAMNFNTTVFKLAFNGSSTPTFTLNETSVTLLGQTPPASSIAAGALGSLVRASSVSALSVPVLGINATGTAGSGNFLRGDGSWNAPSASQITAGALGTSVMTASVAALSVLVQGINASGTPGSGNFLRGDGSWNAPSASQITAGSLASTVVASSVAAQTLNAQNMNASGTPSASTFLRGDGAWATPAGGAGGTTAWSLYVSSSFSLQVATGNFNVGNGLKVATYTSSMTVFFDPSDIALLVQQLVAQTITVRSSITMTGPPGNVVIVTTQSGMGLSVNGTTWYFYTSSSVGTGYTMYADSVAATSWFSSTNGFAGGSGLFSVVAGSGSNVNNILPGNIVTGILGALVRCSSLTALTVNMQNINATGAPGSGNFLRGDGTWNAPSASQITSGALASNVVASSVAAQTLNAQNMNASGTPSATTFLRGDGAWATPAGGAGGTTAWSLYVSSSFALTVATGNFNVGNGFKVAQYTSSFTVFYDPSDQNLTMLNLSFNTTEYIQSISFVGMGVASGTVVGSSNVAVSLFTFDGFLSTAANNYCIAKFLTPRQFVAGSTPTFSALVEVSTGLTSQQSNYVISFATGGTNVDPQSLTYSNPLLVNITGTTVSGGERANTTLVPIPGAGIADRLAPGVFLYARIVRDGINDANNAQSKIEAMEVGFPCRR